MSWFNEQYENTSNSKDFVKMKDVYTDFKRSDLFINMNRKDKRRNSKKKLTKDIISNPNFRGLYYERKMIDQVDYRSIIIKYRIREKNGC